MAGLLFLFATNYGCQKFDGQILETPAESVDGKAHQRDINAEFYQIGAAKPNPYEVENMRKAYNNLFEPDIVTLAPNYKYYRFSPSQPEHLRDLLKSGYDLFDYPLHHEIIERGESYHDPAIADPSYTYLYGVIKIGDPVPSVPNIVIADLAMVSEESTLAQEVFRLAGAPFQTPDTFSPNPPLVGGTFNFVIPNPDGTGTEPPTGGEEPPSGGGSCGCPNSNHQRKPSGCVRVEDNQLNTMEAVPGVKVRVSRDQFFGDAFVREDETDAGGCWMIDKKYHGSIHIRVEYETSLCHVKVMNTTTDLIGYTFPHQSYEGVFWGPNYQGIELKHMRSAAQNSMQYRRWIASTNNASLSDYTTFCSGAQISVPPSSLKILITPLSSGGGAAPMLDKGGIIYDAVLAAVVVSAAAVAVTVLGVIPGVAVGIIGSMLAIAAPDVVFNFSSVPNSDQARLLFNHEFAHVSHFQSVGSNYWLDNIFYTLGNGINGNNPPYGTPTTPESGRCAVIETWAEFIDEFLTDARYGLRHSNGTPADEKTYAARLEGKVFEGSSAPTFFPSAWYFDLVDNNATNPFVATEPSGVVDKVKNYSPGLIFGTMTTNTTSLIQVRDAINTNTVLTATGNNLADFVTLAAPYGL